jgi:Protein of unknown function (DUF4244)
MEMADIHSCRGALSGVNRLSTERTIQPSISRLQAYPTDATPGGMVCDTPEEGIMTQDISVADAIASGRSHSGYEEPVAAPSSRRNQRGMVSAEWAVGIIAAVAIAGVLLAIVTNGEVEDALLNFILMVIRSFSEYLK